MSPADRDAILGRRARLVALSLASVGLSLQPQASAQAPPASSASAPSPASSASAPSPASAAPARAPSEQDKQNAKKLYVMAQDELLNGSPGEAVQLLLQAVRLHPHPRILERLFEALEQTNNPIGALEVADQLLASPDLDPDLRAKITERAARISSRVATLILPQTRGELRLDRNPVAGKQARVMPGSHELESRDGECISRLKVTVAAGETREIKLGEPDCHPAVCLSPPPPPPPPPPGGGCGCSSPGSGT